MLIDLTKPLKKIGIDIIEEKYKYHNDYDIQLNKYKFNCIKKYKPAYVIYQIEVDLNYYYDIEIVILTEKINSFNLSIYEKDEVDTKLSYNLDDLKRLFKFTLYPKKNIYIKILNNIPNETLDIFKISFSKKKYISQLISADNID